MTLPFINAVRVQLKYKNTDSFLAGSRFFLTYAGTPPSPANCVTLAGDIGSAWASHLGPVITDDWTLTEVDVIDLSSDTASSGQSSTGWTGTEGTGSVQAQTAMNVEYNIARRYRGGKPRMYIPGAPAAGLADISHWNGSTVTSFETAVSAFFTALEALSIGSMGTLDHVNVNYYKGYDKNQPPTGKWRGPGFKYPPLPRDTPQIDPVEGYAPKVVVGSQKRRRVATTP